MAYPPTYERSFSFTDWEAANPGQPKPGVSLDTEFDDVSNALTATQDNLALIQRADGALANDSVGEDQIQDGLLDGIADGITADAETAAAAAAASASAAAGSAAAADASADAADISAAEASGAAAMSGASQSIAQDAANAAALSAGESADSALASQQAANDTAGSVAQAELHEEMAFKWAELLTGPVLPAPPGWPEAVDDGMFSAKWWAIRARSYNSVTEIDLGSGQADIGAAFDEWDLTNDLPLGLVYATWGTPPQVYVLTDPSDPSDPASWTSITGPVGPQGPPGAGGLANPTALVGLTPVNGVSTAGMRADAAPALDQSIGPQWTGLHEFRHPGGIIITSAAPQILLFESDVTADNRKWFLYADDGELNFSAWNFTDTVGTNFLKATRNSQNITVVDFGNATSNPAYNFLGTGLVTFRGGTNFTGLMQAAGVEGISGQVLSSQGPGLPVAWRTPGGGAIELGYNFNSSILVAQPGAQKLAFNNTAFTTTTALHVNSLAFTNFDANTILSLLQAGNRIYIQQRNDASKAVVFQVAAPATNNTGWWSVPVTHINSLGTPFPNNADLNCVFILSSSGSGGAVADPTSTIGLAAVNGVATTAMRSDGAPALSQAIAPTWTGTHTFASTSPIIRFSETDGAADEKNWAIGIAAKVLTLRTYDDALTGSRNILTVTRGTGVGVTDISFGDLTGSASTYAFLGTGVVTTGGVIRGPGGAPAGPTYSFTGETNLGMYRVGTGVLGFAVGGTGVVTLSAGTLTLTVNIRGADGTVGAPSYTFSSDINTGFYSGGADDLRLTTGGTFRASWTTTVHTLRLPMQGADGTAAAPGYAFENDPDSGMYRSTTNVVGISAGATVAATFTSAGVNAPAFNATSSRAIKRETGAPSKVSDILSRLRPILYRLLTGSDHEQLGLIAEEVHDVCPQLSDGKTVAYDRLAILLLAAWQEQNTAAA